MHHVNAAVIYRPEGKLEDDILINILSLESCYLKPDEIVNKEIFYMGDMIHFQPRDKVCNFSCTGS